MGRARLVLPVTVVCIATAIVLVVHGCERAASPTAPAAVAPHINAAKRPKSPDTLSAHIGQWAGPVSWPLVTIHASVLPNGNVLAWSGDPSTHLIGTAEGTTEWNPATSAFTSVPNNTTDIFCSGHTLLADGTVLVAGGHIALNVGHRHVNTFSYLTGTWTTQSDMADGRWYPTITSLADGRALALTGDDEQGLRNLIPELWNGTSWTQLTTASLSLPLYSWAFVAPDGRVFVAGSNPQGRLLNVSGTGSWQDVARSNYGWRDQGTSVMYDVGKVLITGGSATESTTVTNTAETIDLTQLTPTWRYTSSMTYARRHANATILPDGTVLVTGGTSAAGFNNPTGAVYAAELWNPATGAWTTLASMKVQRLYHSVALLLPDGRVLSAGGGKCGTCTTDHYDAEFFSPPYLFNGARPTISGAPAQIGYGTTATIQTPQASSIAQVTLVRLSSVTHSFNQSQRFARMPIVSRTATSVSVTAPASAPLAPPGYYLLFILDGNGIPSVGAMVKIG